MKFPTIWYTIWYLEALPVVCNKINAKNISYYCMVGNFCRYKFHKTGEHPGFRYTCGFNFHDQ